MRCDTREGAKVFEYWYSEYHSAVHPVVIDGRNVTFNIVTKEDNGSFESITRNYAAFVNDTAVEYLMAPFGTMATSWAAAVTDPAGKVLITPSSSSSLFNQHLRRTFSSWPPISRYLLGFFFHFPVPFPLFPLEATNFLLFWCTRGASHFRCSRVAGMLPLLRFAGMKTAVIYRAPFSSPGIAGEVCVDLPQQLAEHDIYLQNTYIVDYFRDSLPTADGMANWTSTARQIALGAPDLVVCCAFSNDTIVAMAKTWMDMNWTPKIAAIATDTLIFHNELTQYWIAADAVRFSS